MYDWRFVLEINPNVLNKYNVVGRATNKRLPDITTNRRPGIHISLRPLLRQ
jgi:hypothetical protein